MEGAPPLTAGWKTLQSPAAGGALPQNKCIARSGFSAEATISPYFKFQNHLIGTGPFRGMEPVAALSSLFKG